MKTNKEILDKAIDRNIISEIPIIDRSDFMKKLDCFPRQVALQAMDDLLDEIAKLIGERISCLIKQGMYQTSDELEKLLNEL